MRSFAGLIVSGMRARGHIVRETTAPVVMARLAGRNPFLLKWLGYIDQYALYALWLRLSARFIPKQTLCVFTDQALGPWVPAFSRHPHVVHVHDLLSLQASQGLQPFHQLTITGRLQQRWIRRGFRQAQFFLSVSAATRHILTQELQRRPLLNAVLPNPLLPFVHQLDASVAEAQVFTAIPNLGVVQFLLHVGTVWYKNRQGVLAIWEMFCTHFKPIALVLVGPLEPALQSWLDQRQNLQAYLYVLDSPPSSLILALYHRAAALLFPSHAEGFGWPVLEALACGCPVITTALPPLTEVGGSCVTYIPPAPLDASAQSSWALYAAEQVAIILARSPAEQMAVRSRGIAWAKGFRHERWLVQLESYYDCVLK